MGVEFRAAVCRVPDMTADDFHAKVSQHLEQMDRETFDALLADIDETAPSLAEEWADKNHYVGTPMRDSIELAVVAALARLQHLVKEHTRLTIEGRDYYVAGGSGWGGFRSEPGFARS